MPRRLIEEAFPLQKVSEDSKHEKNVRHGHISTLHIWPARRPLAACRAVTIATLLPDPADASPKMKEEYTRLSGSPLPEKQREYLCNDLIAFLTRWGDENGEGDWDQKAQEGRWFNKLRIVRELIQMAYEGNPPKVLDMFAGGGAIPLEAMRLGCAVTANDYNPVAWFLLKCTLEYPQRLAGKTAPLPKLNLDEQPDLAKGDLADHVRLWGQWILENARNELLEYYPMIDEKPTVAYLWARTVPCQDPQCGAVIPLLKTLWICKKGEKILKDTPENRNRSDFLRFKETKTQKKVVINAKRALKLTANPETKRVRFDIFTPKNEDDVGMPTISNATATCPFCSSQQPKDYIKRCGHEEKLKSQMTAVVYQAEYGKEYRPPTQTEINKSEIPAEALESIANQIPYGIPDEALPKSDTSGAGRAFTVPLYGFKKWSHLFTERQLLVLMTLVKWTRTVSTEIQKTGYSSEWSEVIDRYLAININRLASYSSKLSIWSISRECQGQTFARYALPITWDFSEINPFSGKTGDFLGGLDWIQRFLDHALKIKNNYSLHITQQTSTTLNNQCIDAIITDPPYYDAIPYADISDFFYVWLRRSIGDQFPNNFAKPLTPKSAELIQHSGRFNGDNEAAKTFYESGMAATFQSAYNSLTENGRIVIVFAHKSPDAWETLVKAMIESGLVVTASWPIDTEMQGGLKANQAALATSLWLVCRKRSKNGKPGHYSKVKNEMEKRVTERLRYFWDAGIRGPDFVWSAIGPALESFSCYGEVRRIDKKEFTVNEFLMEVRRIVTDFALGQILHGASTEALDEWTRYYLMHKDYFGMEDAPVGECILLAQGYGVSLDDLRTTQTGFLKKARSGNSLKLLGHKDRTSDRIGYVHTSGRIPMIDMIHRIMNLWNEGESAQINAYFHEHGLQENTLFKAVVQALIETNFQGSDERSLLETLINYEPGELVSTVPSSGKSDTGVVQLQLPLGEISNDS
ncbi:MAG: DUF1156 domain-containing protein [Candidatus Poribacteria bacterium]|nr:DUF1156 domain-containing protein [Candidatus Poribacteria bacterium]